MKSLKKIYLTHERRLLTLVFIGGFVFDALTLTRVDGVIDNLILTTYLILAALSIFLWNTSSFIRSKETLHRLLPAITQFSFGALFSGFVVFYSRGGFFVGHLPFFLLLLILILGNERLHRQYQRLTFQMSIFFVTTYLYSLFILPIILKQLGLPTFILGGMVSLALSFGLIHAIHRRADPTITQSKKTLIASIAFIYLIINILYFTNTIPPLPLSLKEIGVYHSITRQQGNYIVTGEKTPWNYFRLTEQFHAHPGQPVYIFSSVFAPTELSTTIVHEWFYFDETNKNWVLRETINFPIIGGRDSGYRGYSMKEDISAGLWRVDVKTERRQLIGRVRFKMISAIVPSQLTTSIK